MDITKLKHGDPVTFEEGDAEIHGYVQAVQMNPNKMVDVMVIQKGHKSHGLVVKVHPDSVTLDAPPLAAKTAAAGAGEGEGSKK